MNKWEKDDVIDILIKKISRTYKKKGTPRKQNSPRSKRSSATPPTPVKVWTKDQREEATRKKADEADAAAANGVRRSRRARVPTEKVLNGE
jgi:hypothetical protein